MEKKYINKDNIVKISLVDKQKINYSLKYSKNTWKKRPIKFIRKGEKWDNDYYIIHYFLYNGIYTKNEISNIDDLILINDDLFKKPYVKISLSNNRNEYIYFNTFNEIEDWVNDLGINNLISI